MVARFGTDPREERFGRCIRCNRPLEGIGKEEAEGKVPPYVFRTREVFGACAGCGRIYWRATHTEDMERRLDEMLGR